MRSLTYEFRDLSGKKKGLSSSHSLFLVGLEASFSQKLGIDRGNVNGSPVYINIMVFWSQYRTMTYYE